MTTKTKYPDAFKEHQLLLQKVNKLNVQHYEHDESDVSDEMYDVLLSTLNELEKKHPDLKTPDSPTQRVGGKVKDGFAPYPHAVPMLSLENAITLEEVLGWAGRAGLTSADTISVEPKLDGIAMDAHYIDGKLVSAATRGDGQTGETVTHNAKTIRNLPLTLKGKYPKDFHVRGEVFITKADFNHYNEMCIITGNTVKLNARNSAAGAMRQLDPVKSYERRLSFQAYGVVVPQEQLTTHTEWMAKLDSYGIQTVTGRTSVKCSRSEIHRMISKLTESRSNSPMDIDGIVFKVNPQHQQNQLGSVGKDLRWAISYKFKSEDAKSTLLDVIWQVGKHGTVTPVAIIKPVLLCGVTVSRATLHNVDEIARLKLKINDSIRVERKGDVIPKITQSVVEPSSIDIVIPTECPCCGGPLHRLDGAVALTCIAGIKCPAQQARMFVSFGSRARLNIKGLGAAMVGKLLASKTISTFESLYTLTPDQVEGKTGENLIEEINKSRTCTFDKFLYALCIMEVGESASSNLAQHYGCLTAILDAGLDDLCEVDDIGPETARNIVNYFNENKDSVLSLAEHFTFIEAERTNDDLAGKVYVITGSFSDYSKDQIKTNIIQRGGKVSSSVSAKVTAILVGNKPGSKLSKAIKLNLPQITNIEDLK